MNKNENDLFAFLDVLGIEHSTVEHPPIFTEHDETEWLDRIPGLHTKNLLLDNKNGDLLLVVMPMTQRADIKSIARQAGVQKLSFANSEKLLNFLSVPQGSLTPFALINDTSKKIKVIVDTDIIKSQHVNFHPLRNTASTTIASSDLLKFIKALGYVPLVITCSKESPCPPPNKMGCGSMKTRENFPLS